MRTVYSPDNVWVEFQRGHSRFGNMEDWLRYGKPIEHLCAGLPLYQLSNTQRKFWDQKITFLLQRISTFPSFEPKSMWYL